MFNADAHKNLATRAPDTTLDGRRWAEAWPDVGDLRTHAMLWALGLASDAPQLAMVGKGEP